MTVSPPPETIREPPGLPKGVKLVRIGGPTAGFGDGYRAVWDLGNGLGHAWYDFDSWEQLKSLFGVVAVPDIVVGNYDQFNQQFGNYYWGKVSEIDLKAETPWQSLTTQIFGQFGFVPGMDSLEVRRMLLQAYFEKWTTEQFQVEYRKTDAFKSTTDAQRRWVGLSPAEKNQQIEITNVDLSNQYRSLYGQDAPQGSLRVAAESIASGKSTIEQWLFTERQRAGGIEGTPEWARRIAEQRAANAPINERENMALFAEQRYRAWVGPGVIPPNWASTWGQDLSVGTKSEADLETYLKSLAQSRWAMKPPDLTWEDWASGYKAQIGETLELGSVDDRDPLLNKILRSDLNGVDLEAMIRSDNRFRSTQAMFGELSRLATDMGQRFGFIT